MKEISNLVFKQLKEYTLSHESDIAWKINDFEGLETAFIELHSRPPTIMKPANP